MHTDPIADMLTRLKNAYRATKDTVVIPFSKIKLNIAEILKKEGCVSSIAANEKNREIELTLRYSQDKPAISDIKRLSCPGKRVYVDKDHLPRMQKAFGFAIISTPQGLMTGFEAKKRKIGGEVICKVYKFISF